MRPKTYLLRLMAIMMVCLTCGISAGAYDFYSGGIYYTKLASNTVEVAYRDVLTADYSGSVTIPSTVTYGGVTYTVTGIGYCAFGECTNLTSVSLPSTLTYVGELAFIRCNSLTSISIPTGVTWIGSNAFAYCHGLTSVSIPSTVKTIGHNAFVGCEGLTAITIPGSVESIGNGAFNQCFNLEYVFCTALTPPTLGNNVFWSSVLQNATLVVNNLYVKTLYEAADGWKDFSNIMAVNNYNFQSGGIYYCQTSFNTVAVCAKDQNYNSYSGSVTVPSTVTYDNRTYTVTEVAPSAFRNCTSLTRVTLPETITRIGDFAFTACSSLITASLPTSSQLTEIGNNTFAGCSNLLVTWLPTTLTKIGNYAFNGCHSITSITLPDNVTSVGASAFSSCTNLKSVTIGKGCTSLGEWCFMECTALQTVTSYATTPPAISYYTFRNNNGFTSATLRVLYTPYDAYTSATYWSNFTSVTRLGYDFKYNNNFYRFTGSNTVGVANESPSYNTYSGSVTIPSQVVNDGTTYRVTSICGSAFSFSTGLTSVTLPSSITRIEYNAFYKCSGLTAITIPAAVNYIGSQAFVDCTGLTRVNIPNLASWLGIEMVNEYSNPLYYAHNLYVASTKLTDMTVPSSVTQIKQNAMVGCTSITTVTLHDNVTTVGYAAFKNCSNLGTLTLGEGVTAMGGSAFNGCSALNSIHSNATTPPAINATTFDSNTYAGALYVPDYHARSAYRNAPYWQNFSYIGSMKDYDFEVNGIYYKITSTSSNTVSVSRINHYDEGYSGDVVIPETVTHDGTTYTVAALDFNAFTASPGLTSVTIPATVTTVVEAFFNNMATNLTSITCLAIVPPTGMTQMTSDQYAGVTVTVPKNSVAAYQANSGWGQFATIQGMAYDFERDGLCYNITGSNAVEVTYRSTSYNSYSGPVSIPASVTLAGVTYNVTAVGASAFRNSTGLTSITFPTSIKSIGNYAFYQCTGLTNGLLLPQGLESIGNYAFAHCTGITSVLFPYSISSVGTAPFGWCTSLTNFRRLQQPHGEVEYVIKNGVVFNNFTNTLAIFPGGKALSYTVPDGTASIGAHAFRGSIVKTVSLPTTLRTIDYFAFANCESLTGIEVPKGVTAIGESAFSNCTALTAVILPSTLQTLGGRAFYNDGALTSVSCKATTPPTCQLVSVGSTYYPPFDASHFQNARLRVPTGCKNTYKAAPIWKLFTSIVESSSLDEIMLGDVDGDGMVGINDVTLLIDYLLDSTTVLILEAADVDGNGAVGIGDVTAIIDIILKG